MAANAEVGAPRTSRANSARVAVQKFGTFLSGMIMPNIAAFIAWGLITALFIPTGWWPNATLAGLVDPTIKYLLPILIGYTGGRLVHGQEHRIAEAFRLGWNAGVDAVRAGPVVQECHDAAPRRMT